MSLGIVLHGAISYMQAPMPKLRWAVRDAATSGVFDWLFWYLHGFRVPVFFLMAGFFAVMLYESRGARGFLAHRTKRILVPLLVGSATLLPIIFVVWAYGWYVSGAGSVEEGLRQLKASSSQFHKHPTGAAHLWFLQYLYIYCLVFWGVCVVRNRLLPAAWAARRPRVRRVDQLLASAWRPLVLALPCWVILYVAPGAVIDYHNSPYPQPWALLYHAVFFAAGIWLYRLRGELHRFTGYSWGYLLLSLLVFASMMVLLGRHLAGGLSGAGHLALAGSMSLFAWLSAFGYLGLSLRLVNRPNALVRYLSDASYWIYLCHLPIVALAQVLIFPVPGPAGLKFLFVVVATSVVALLSYRYLVRYSFVGTWLNGPRTRPPQRLAALATERAGIP